MTIYVIAGEPSGDLLGGRLMAGLKARTAGEVAFAGIGGESMRAEGLESLFPMAELTVMGLVEVLPRVPRILRRVRETLDDIAAKQPDAIVTIDSWGFTGRVQKGCQSRFPHIPRIHYVAPMVWAWKPKRTKKLAAVLDLLMTLLPFEPEWFEKDGLRSVHVGHPVVESGAERGDGAAFRLRHGIAADAPVLVALPGSRMSETGRLLPLFVETLARLAERFPDLVVVVPTVETVAVTVRAAAAHWPLRAIIVDNRTEKYDAFAAGTAGLAASGTVALELALAGLPSVVVYRVSALTAFVARRFMGFKIKWATLVNMVLDRAVMPEFLQEECRADQVAPAIAAFLDDFGDRAARRADMAEAMRLLGYGGPSPSDRAAATVLDFIAERRTP
ncbi:lipid-A-disaccharide synthase [Magnetospirillum aberrantis SpK]|uniref:Lipid-A-disaccharide synthase n=1 Tax=Magnetospirillum aberrantis SpK TaxID=908842 RepID=A0A7C9UT37_9PROT|nr:lipid-A-disaccharide synthase [Magnetospirillum aberrantis]NFV79807.1 lipid-A-disaccharide synthase [Magnetospirillum aberrantis SpK]